MTDNMDAFRALALAIKISARRDPNPLLGRSMPKGWECKERYE
jgi:hypothetical protein